MKDRLPTHPGRVTLTPVEGQSNTYDMVRADEPTQAGTPLNKNSLLSDATAALYGLDENAVPDDALRLAAYFNWREVARFDVAGAYKWTSDFDGELGVLVVGGGGSGSAARSSSSTTNSAYGGAGGYRECAVVPVYNDGQPFNIVVGAGGASVTKEAGTSKVAGNNGGTSSFGSRVIAEGGEGGYGGTGTAKSNLGGQPVILYSEKTDGNGGKFGRAVPFTMNSSYSNEDMIADMLNCEFWKNINVFTGEEIIGAGGSATASKSSTSATPGGKSPLTRLGGGDGACGSSSDGDESVKAEDATMFGCGGGGASGYSCPATSGAGADGIVILYRKVVV